MGALSRTGLVRNGGRTGSVMKVKRKNESSIYSGVIQNGATGTLGLTKGGNASNTSALTLAGAESNTYTGMTTVSSGTLILAKTGGAVAIGGDLTLGDGAGSAADMLQLNGSEQIIDTSMTAADPHRNTEPLRWAFSSKNHASVSRCDELAGATSGFTSLRRWSCRPSCGLRWCSGCGRRGECAP